MIDITGIDLKEFAKAVYAMSVPAGMGFMHFQAGPLPDEAAQKLVDHSVNDSRLALKMDYVGGATVQDECAPRGRQTYDRR